MTLDTSPRRKAAGGMPPEVLPERNRSAASRIARSIRRTLLTLWPFLIAIGAWQAWVWIGDLHPLVVPSPGSVFADVGTDPGPYLTATWRTVVAAGLGLLIGTLIGVVTALGVWVSLILRGLFTTSMILMYSAPIVATIPLMARVLGYSDRTVLAVAALVSMFPTFVLVSSGLRTTPAGSIDVLTALGARRAKHLWHLAVPSAMPNFFVALRLNAAVAFVAAIIGEYLTGVDGLGTLFQESFARFNVTRAWGASIVIVAFSIVSYAIASRIEERGIERWT
jgi:NitT/TauT family transport system permease protein